VLFRLFSNPWKQKASRHVMASKGWKPTGFVFQGLKRFVPRVGIVAQTFLSRQRAFLCEFSNRASSFLWICMQSRHLFKVQFFPRENGDYQPVTHRY
jgi:hypothetical protein